MAKPSSRAIDVLLFDGVNLLDVAGPVQVFKAADYFSDHAYTLRFVTRDGAPVTACCGLTLSPDATLSARSKADDLLIPGGTGVDDCFDDVGLRRILASWLSRRPNGRLISVCSGALILADSGALDGREATTHWSRAATARERFPNVNWQLDRIYVTGERIFTSAGVTTGIDMALAIIRQDCGPAVTLAVGRELVVQMQRSGGQQQFSVALTAQQDAEPLLSRLVDLIAANLNREWTLEALADAANTSPRSLSRKFNQHFAMSPAKFIERLRIDRARDALLHGASLKSVAAECGFGDPQRMRRAFTRHLGISAADYAASFGNFEGSGGA
jgi:transcriptional regulator GlxA family with amidase domain